MTVDNITRLVRALGDDAQRSNSLSKDSKNNVESVPKAEAANSSDQAVKFTSQFTSSKAEGAGSAREARVAHFKAQYDAGILKPADSDKVAEAVARELLV